MKRRLSITDWIYNMDLGIKRGLRTECRLPAAVRVFYTRSFAGFVNIQYLPKLDDALFNLRLLLVLSV